MADGLEHEDRFSELGRSGRASSRKCVGDHRECLFHAGAGSPGPLLGGGDRDAEELGDLGVRHPGEVMQRDNAPLTLGKLFDRGSHPGRLGEADDCFLRAARRDGDGR